jgi:hypothetical protein
MRGAKMEHFSRFVRDELISSGRFVNEDLKAALGGRAIEYGYAT